MDESIRTVVGAGPAGFAAAINLALAGLNVHVRERRPMPGFRHHGFQGIENWSEEDDALIRLRRFGIDPAVVLRPEHEVSFYGPSREERIVFSEFPLFYFVRRGEREDSLDRKLEERAKEMGVRITYNDTVRTAPVNTIVGVGPTSAMAIAKGITFKTDAANMATCIVDPEIAPKAYAYLLIHEGEGTLATMLTQEYKSASSYLKKAIEAFQGLKKFSIEKPVEFGGYGGVEFSGKCVLGGHLRVGEFGGGQDALWGFGLWYALESGYLAAKALTQNVSYEKLFRKRLLKRMRRLLVSRWLFDRLPRSRYEGYLRSFAGLENTRERIRRAYGGSFWLNALYPFALRSFHVSKQEERCHMEHCDCIWCMHGKEELVVPQLERT